MYVRPCAAHSTIEAWKARLQAAGLTLPCAALSMQANTPHCPIGVGARVYASTSPRPLLMQELDLSHAVIEASRLLHLTALTCLTALYLSHVRLPGVPAMPAGFYIARTLAPLTQLQRVSLQGFMSCSEAALAGVDSLSAQSLTFLDLCGALIKCRAAPLHFDVLAALTGLRELHMLHVPWWEQGVSAGAAGQVFGSLQQLRTLWLGVPGNRQACEWVTAALATTSTTLRVLFLRGMQPGPGGLPELLYCNDSSAVQVYDESKWLRGAARTVPWQPEALDKVRVAITALGVHRFASLRALILVGSEQPPPSADCAAERAAAMAVGLPPGALLMHLHNFTRDVHARGGLCCLDEHPNDMCVAYERYAARS